jgi:hypothetical protein
LSPGSRRWPRLRSSSWCVVLLREQGAWWGSGFKPRRRSGPLSSNAWATKPAVSSTGVEHDSFSISLILLCDFSFAPVLPWLPSRPRSTRWESSCGCMPVIDARFLVAPQRGVDHLHNCLLAWRCRPQQLREDRPHLRRRHRRCFFSSRSRSTCKNHNANSDSVM